ncbi:MAG: hypothetical protein ABIR62_03385 [Dokdonella sp.]|uniref:hypothetical protein n=1 Tax=Dokdonella sp. TaxID=2291710 RepID=UPI003267DF2E
MELALKSDDEIRAVADPIMDNLMRASTAIDYHRHTRDFTERARSVLSSSAFECICRQYQQTQGDFAERTFVAAFRRPASVAVVWRQTFTKAPGDYVAEIVLVQRGDQTLVDHVMVF